MDERRLEDLFANLQPRENNTPKKVSKDYVMDSYIPTASGASVVDKLRNRHIYTYNNR
ncbi:hypothetical protein [Anaerosporobacter faecicola]|uniref:hypothetical protein n=1 Tax=Anaerosporobacter faecicola TaxID=2718714 RepID=UPI00143871C9|nr:hypothetical protein [Anaerosporobacter faecicola]